MWIYKKGIAIGLMVVSSVWGGCLEALAEPKPETTTKDTGALPQGAAGKKFEKPYGHHLDPILQKINASPDQKQKITAVVMSYRPKIEPLREEYREKSRQFISYIITGQNEEMVMAQQGELNKLYSLIVSQYSLMNLEVRKLLRPEQTRDYEEYRRQQGWIRKK